MRFRAAGQFVEHLGLGSPKYEGTDQRRQSVPTVFIFTSFDWVGETFLKTLPTSEEARGDHAENAPQLADVVFQRSTGQRQPPVSVQIAGRAGGLRHRILDELSFVQDERGPCPLVEPLKVDA